VAGPSQGSSGRSRLLAALVVPMILLAGLTQWEVGSLGSVRRRDGDQPVDGAELPHLAFGSVTSEGAILFRVGQPVHVWAVDGEGATRWERDFTDGEYLACGPCPSVIVRHPDGAVTAIGPGGAPAAPPAALGSRLAITSSPVGVVLASVAIDGRVSYFVPTSAGLIESGISVGARLDQPLVAVTPALVGGAVTVMQASADALRQGEFEVLHITPERETKVSVALDPPTSRPLPCAVADAATVAYVLVSGGPGADGATRVVVSGEGVTPVDSTVTGVFDSCSVGPSGVVLANAANGENGDLRRTVVRLAWLGPGGLETGRATEQVEATTASVALDPRSSRAVVAGGPDRAVVLDGHARREIAAARAVAFDDRGGLWHADRDGRVRREELR
jgi:hypothetical protein